MWLTLCSIFCFPYLFLLPGLYLLCSTMVSTTETSLSKNFWHCCIVAVFSSTLGFAPEFYVSQCQCAAQFVY